MRDAMRWIAALTMAWPLACNMSALPEGARLGAEPASLFFSAFVHGDDPSPVSFTVRNVGTGALAAPTVEVRFSGAAGWLSASVSGDAPPYAVTLTPVGVRALTPALYYATVSLHAPEAVNAPLVVPVTLDVHGPSLQLDAQALSFHQRLHGEPRALVIQATDEALLQDYQTRSMAKPVASVRYPAGAPDWLSATVGDFASGFFGISVQARTDLLSPGLHVAHLDVAVEGAVRSPTAVTVYLRLEPWALTRDLALPLTQGLLTGAFISDTATRLPGGKVLVTGYQGCQIYDPAADLWALTGPLAVPRSGHAATLLDDGRILVTGGRELAAEAKWEIFDPASGSWSSAGSLAGRFMGHTATRMADGRVLLAAGGDGLRVVEDTEIFDPSDGTSSPAGAMSTTHGDGAAAVLLPSGEVLLVGGRTAREVAELYDPVAESWSATGSLGMGRSGHALVLLPNGKVLAAGGRTGPDDRSTASAELYDPATGTWSPTAPMASARAFAPGVLLDDGLVMVVGGEPDTFDPGVLHVAPGAERYDPANESWSRAGDLQIGRTRLQVVPLTAGGVLAVGGQALALGVIAPGEVDTRGGENPAGTAERWEAPGP